MPGLSFLSKKSWHVKNLDNQERVWLAEQAKAAEDAKTKELADQIKQEREAEELARIAGKKSGGDRGTSWMYEGGTAATKEKEAEREAEEYLLGKEYNPAGNGSGKVKAAGDFDALASGASVDQIVGAAAAASVQERDYSGAAAAAAASNTAESNPVADRNEEFHRRYEDPMYMVSQRKKERDTDAQKKKALFEKVMGGTAVPAAAGGGGGGDNDDDRDRRKKKRKKKSSSSRRRSRSRSKNRSRSRSRSRDRFSRKSSKRHKKDRRGEKRNRDRSSRSRSRSQSRSRSRSRDDYHHGRKRRHNGGSRSRSRSRDRYDRRDGIGRSYKKGRSRSRSRRSRSPPRRHGEESKTAAAKPAGFGLQGGSGQSSTSGGGSGGGIGPDTSMLAKKREEKEMAKERYRSGRNRQRRHLSAEEREEALKSMQSTASAVDAARSAKIASAPKRSADEEEDIGGEARTSTAGRGEASFLRDMSTKVHGMGGGASMADRIGRNRHTNQRGSESFL